MLSDEDFNSLAHAILTQLPLELQDEILDHAGVGHFRVRHDFPLPTGNPVVSPAVGNPEVPPADGSSPFMNLSTELRNVIFNLTNCLPPKDKVYEPSTERKRSSLARDLLTINKTIFQELTTMLYEDRTFAIHVYEGIQDGGIEFLNSGRQPLQHQHCYMQISFPRFQKNDDFGVGRIKHIAITIHAAGNTSSDARHICMHTHFIIQALCKLLVQGHEGESIKRLTFLLICFKATPLYRKPGRT